MGNEYFDLNIRVKATSEDAALELVKKQLGDVSAKVKEAGDSAKGAGGFFSELGSKLKELAVAAGVAMGLAEVVRLIKDGAREAMADERALGALVIMLGQFDKTLVGAKEKAEKFGESMKQVGMDDGEVYVGLRQLIPITGQYENAAKGVALAWNLHIATGMDYATMLDLIAGLIANKPKALTQAMSLLGEKYDTTQHALDALTAKFGDFASKIDDQQMKVDKLAIKWHDFWKMIGGEAAAAILDGIELAGKLGDKLQAVVDRLAKGKTSGDSAFTGEKARKDAMQFHEDSIAYFEKELAKVEKGTDKWYEYTKAISENVEAWRKLKGTSESGMPSGPPKANDPKEDPKKDNGKEADAVTKLAEAYRDLGAAEADAARQKMLEATSIEGATAAFQKAYSTRLRAAEMERQAIDANYRQQITQEGLTDKAKAALHDKYVIDIMRAEMKLNADLSHLGDDLTKTWAKDLKQDEANFKEMLLKKEADEKASEQRRQTNSKKFEDLHKKREISERAGELKAMRQELITELFDLRTNEQRKHEILKQFAQLNTEIAKEEARAKRDLALQTAADAFMAASQAFGNNKALAIAGTVISTYKSAQEAYEAMASIPYVGPALGIAAAAAAVAAGLARVQQISSAEPSASAEKGYDIPEGVNPVVYAHAREMVLPREEADVIRALAARPSSIINNRQRGPEIHMTVNNPIGATTDYAYRQLDRRLRTAGRQNDRSIFLTGRTSIGTTRRRK